MLVESPAAMDCCGDWVMDMVSIGLESPTGIALTTQEQKALQILLESHDSGVRLRCDPWQFALALRELENQQISVTTIRCLVQMALVAHGLEKTRLKSPYRKLVPVSHLRFTENSSFILTGKGLDLATSLGHKNGSVNGAAATTQAVSWVPSFVVCENGCRELRFAGKVAKRFNAYAERQETILQAFQEQGWAPWIADPLTSSPRQNPKIRLRDAIARLNRRQLHRLLRFQGDGTGRGIRWSQVTPDNKDATGTQQSDI